ncbi:MAG: tetratricopeptide repeat protein [Promethearchaeota archaeon]
MNITDIIKELIEKAIDLRKQDKFKEALEILENLYTNNPNSKYVKKYFLETLFAYGGYLNDEFILKYEEARDIFERIIKIDPNNYRAYYNLGIAHFNLSKIEKAKECYEEALKIKPDYKHPLYNIGLIYECEGNLQEALKYYEKALDIDPKFPYAFNARVQILRNLNGSKRTGAFYDRSENIKKLKDLLEVSRRIRIEMIQSLLNIEKDRLFEILIEWSKKYQFEIDGDFLNLNKETLPELLKFLDDWDL